MAMNSVVKSRDTNEVNLFKVHSDQLSLKLSTNKQPKSSFTSKERSVGFLVPDDGDANKSHCTKLFITKFTNNNTNLNYMIADSSIDISVCDLNSDILVSLVDRAVEMQDLFTCNQEYFYTVRQSIFPSSSEQDWNKFLNLLYSSRHVIPDVEWMSAISDHMEPNPTLLAKFKDIVGYCEIDEDLGGEPESTNSESDMMDDQNSLCDYSDSCYTFDEPESRLLMDIRAIRNYPKILENLETSYPQFFLNACQILGQETERKGSVLGGNHLSQARRSSHSSSYSSSYSPPANDSFIFNHENSSNNEDGAFTTLYDEFKSILVAPRQTMSDEEWEAAIYECLDPWPQLIAQFEEIMLFEISNDD